MQVDDFAQRLLQLRVTLPRSLECQLPWIVVHEVDPAVAEDNKLERSVLFLRADDARLVGVDT